MAPRGKKRASDAEAADSTATKRKKVTWRLHLPGASKAPVAADAATHFAASCEQEEEQVDDFVPVDHGRDESYLVQELRQASDRAGACGVVSDGALVQSWVERLVSCLGTAVHTVVAASNYNSAVFDSGGISNELRQTVETHGSDGVHPTLTSFLPLLFPLLF